MGLFDWLFKRNRDNKGEARIAKVNVDDSRIVIKNFENEPDAEEIDTIYNDSSLKKGKVLSEKIDIDVISIENVKKKFIAFDVETTGFSVHSDRIIEIGAVVFEEGQIRDTFNSLVNPKMPIPVSATRVNNITDEMVKNAPEEKIAIERFLQFIGNAAKGEVPMCAHNANFDIGFLSSALRRQGIDAIFTYIDTLSLARKTVKDSVNYKLNTLATYYNIPLVNTHRADRDAEICGMILNKLVHAIDIDLETVREEIRKHTPDEDELEVCAYIQNSIENYGLDVEWLRFTKSTDKYIHIKYLYSFLKIKIAKRGNYIIVRRNAADGIGLRSQSCTKSEGGEEYCRVYFDSVFDLNVLIPYIMEVYSHCRKSALKHIRSSKYCEREARNSIASMKMLTLNEVDFLLKKAESKRDSLRIVEVPKSIKKKKGDIKAKEHVKKKAGRAVYQMTDNMEIVKRYDTISDAVRETGVNSKSIRDAAKGIQIHAGGYVWRYADEMALEEKAPRIDAEP